MESTPVLLLSLLILTFSVSASATTVRAIFTFGDSIFDAGNNHFNKNCTAQADFPPYGSSFFHRSTGRFTNGRTVVDFICEFLTHIHELGCFLMEYNFGPSILFFFYSAQFAGIELQKPYLQAQIEVANGSTKDYPSNGINFASAGSGVLHDTNADLVRKLTQEKKFFGKAMIPHRRALRRALAAML